MKYLDQTLPTPAENLACDEQLLDDAGRGAGGEILRFWESPQTFVVAGYANNIAREVDVAACERRGVPVLRRCSGGGTVVQGPGCLNYALILEIAGRPELQNVTATNRFIMERHRAALAPLLRGDVRVQGHTDLTLAGRKFSGNAQRRRRRCLLFHGTFLLDFDLALVTKLLPLPSRQPDYRRDRPHGRFLTNLHLPAAAVKAALRQAWR